MAGCTLEAAVLIVGAGISGLSVAISFAKLGIQTIIIERDVTKYARAQGYSIALRGNGKHALNILGLSGKLKTICEPESDGSKASHFLHSKASGTGLVTFNTRSYEPKSKEEMQLSKVYESGISVPRWALRDSLLDAALETGKVQVHWGKNLQSISISDSASKHAISVRCADGSRYAAHFLVGSDGVHSTVRFLTLGDPLIRHGLRRVGAQVAPEQVMAVAKQLKQLMRESNLPVVESGSWLAMAPGEYITEVIPP